jgi:hypothetical protein
MRAEVLVTARVYTPDNTGYGRCMVCGRPEGEHARGAWSRACPPAELAARRCETDAVIGSPVEVVDVDLISSSDAQTIARLRAAIHFIERKIDGYEHVFEYAAMIAAGTDKP